MKHIVYFGNEQKKIKVNKEVRDLVRKCVAATLKSEGFEKYAEVSVTFTDDAGIRELNLSARGKDAPTDVLSFPMLENEAESGDEDMENGAVLLGDVVISLERAASQAMEYGHSFERELGFLTVHSMLHLLGYDHEQGPAQEQEMFGKQEAVLSDMGLVR